jgi:hypothetical protein
MMRRDFDSLMRPLESAKHQSRRAALRSRFTLGSIALLIAAVSLIVHMGGHSVAAVALFTVGVAVIAFRIGRLAHMHHTVAPEWLILAVECRLSAEGRAALTPMLLASSVSCEDALDWGHAEAERAPIDGPEPGRSRHLIE